MKPKLYLDDIRLIALCNRTLMRKFCLPPAMIEREMEHGEKQTQLPGLSKE